MTHVLLLEDHALSRNTLLRNLEKEGFTVSACSTGKEALAYLDAAVKGEAPMAQTAILDLNLPDIDGLEILKAIRNSLDHASMGVLLLTAKAEEIDRVVGLELGADDYIAKPFSFRELLARIRAVARRAAPSPASGKLITHGLITVNMERFIAAVDGQPMLLTRRELELLIYFLRHVGQLLTRQQILKEVWGLDHPHDSRTIDVHVRRLRIKLGPAADQLHTVIGTGYRMD